MLKGSKLPVLTLAPQSHVDLFVENYDQLRRWALQFTEYDHAAAEDLLHDTFINFTLSKPDISSIRKIDGYLFIVMRNLHLSHVRRATRLPVRSFSVVEYDTAEMPFWTSDPREHLRMRDELAAVCQFACVRKETSKGGSLLILRFFHGYYPDEIAAIMRTTRAAVNSGLKKFRSEVKLCLENPDQISFINAGKAMPAIALSSNPAGLDLRSQLRQHIFHSSRGECVSEAALTALYVAQTESLPSQHPLAHIVSCEGCLEKVNTLLGLPTLASRYPLDTIGKDPGRKGGDGPGSSGAGGAGGRDQMLESYFTRREEHFHHEPRELCVSVNGQFQGAQRIISGKGELMLSIDTNETVGFVEVFSELGVRLLMLNVEPLPGGKANQATRVELSDGRLIRASLNFGTAFPTLQVSYDDPLIGDLGAVRLQAVETLSIEAKTPFDNFIERAPLFDSVKNWFEPLRIAFAASLLIVGVMGFWIFTQPNAEPLAARAVLKQAREAEFALAPAADKVFHRSYFVEELVNGGVRSQRRIDEWHKQKASARRTYDAQGRMIAGVWTTEDGRRQEFIQGERLVSGRNGSGRESLQPIEPTAAGYSNLVDAHGVTQRVAIEETEKSYVFRFEDRKGETDQKGVNSRLIAATLSLDRETYNPIMQTIVLQIGNDQREYRFSDITVEQKAVADVSPLIFFPESELINGATTVTSPLSASVVVGSELPAAAEAPLTTAATAELEVDVLERLHSIGADISDQIEVKRTPSGRILVEGLLETEKRKEEILDALAPIRNNRAVTVRLQTIEEATRELENKRSKGNASTDVSKVRIEDNTIAADSDLRQYFAQRSGDTDELIRRFAAAAVDNSRAALYQAGALNRMANRFTAKQISQLDPAARGKLLGILKGYAAKIRRDTIALRNQLNPVFGGLEPPGYGRDAVTSESDLIRSARRLFEQAEANDRIVRSALRLTNEGASAAELRSAAFRRSMAEAESLAAAIERAR